MALVSDDLALLDAELARLLDEVIALGRASDAEARAGAPARCPDLMDAALPTRLRSGRTELVADPAAATSRLSSLD